MKAKFLAIAIILASMLAINACTDEVVMPGDGAGVLINGPDD